MEWLLSKWIVQNIGKGMIDMKTYHSALIWRGRGNLFLVPKDYFSQLDYFANTDWLI